MRYETADIGYGQFRLFQHGEHAQRKARVVLKQRKETGRHIPPLRWRFWFVIWLAVRHESPRATLARV
jgi:hypothetical protein